MFCLMALVVVTKKTDDILTFLSHVAMDHMWHTSQCDVDTCFMSQKNQGGYYAPIES